MVLSVCLTILLLLNRSYGVECPSGCLKECFLSNVCSQCKPNYEENDTFCRYCKSPNFELNISQNNLAFYKMNNDCLPIESIRQFEYNIPVNCLTLQNNDLTFSFGKDDQFEFPFYINKHRREALQGIWIKVPHNNESSENRLSLTFSKIVQKSNYCEFLTEKFATQKMSEKKYKIRTHRITSKKLQIVPQIVISLFTESDLKNRKSDGQILFEGNKNTYQIDFKNTAKETVYVSVICLSFCDTTMSLTKFQNTENYTNNQIALSTALDSKTIFLKWENEISFEKTTCLPNNYVRVFYIENDITFKTGISMITILGDSKIQQNIFIAKIEKCVGLLGIFLPHHKKSIDVSVSHKIAIFSDSNDNSQISIEVKHICSSGCGEDENRGYCSITTGGCVCKEEYFGDGCERKCFFNNKWNFSDKETDKKCYFGTAHCSAKCECEDGYLIYNHTCIISTCLHTSEFQNTSNECLFNSVGCNESCQCNSSYFSYENSCVSTSCGNEILEMGEDCDSSQHCLKNCKCEKGYFLIQKNKCVSLGMVVGISISSVVVLFIICITITIVVITKKHSKVIEKVTDQQPEYYMYFSGSSNVIPNTEHRHMISPLIFDFGNTTEDVKVFETLYQNYDVRNTSHKKYMLLLIHTPNTPKYVFHFSPQSNVIPPNTKKSCKVYMTLYCTTQVKGMKIPYTIFFSNTKSTLFKISELLKNKSFTDWTSFDEKTMQTYLKDVTVRYHHYFIISTNAESSTHIDFDEINLLEDPIAEGAMGKVYLGRYRSLPVAVKQYRWSGLTENEYSSLKKSVISECNLMSKLRNPYVVNYVGSVTYIPQISLVMQYLVLGALSEFLHNTSRSFLHLSFKLKVKVLLDTSKGMTFLHQNKILHLDLKPDNLLVNSLFPDSQCCIKITDFGTAALLSSQIEEKGLGTPVYLAPESFTEDVYTEKSDIFSFGITCWEVFYQQEPYSEFKSIFEIKNFVKSGNRLKIDEKMPEELKRMTERCWDSTPEKRGNFEECTHVLEALVKREKEFQRLDKYVDEEKIQKFVLDKNEELRKKIITLGNE
ncbi:serine-threonine protein kinase, putative [Entamoeba invadens IP1]|uniref:Serine-threonine protein kinase, putative n=1 Tax=Entamoeba invadens IP1 TaxID=370355 RepID=A0A0A1U0E7_ENTIV|nr:serine-threonine protein kinase, putative [Entamoeba invadens IP1]ELP85971.1 serine-threonine protein kinase, putative [Entamoeba invadens IP1]|eukprot:XP_004185317.1 serine-threonine protein kinase, putative [Entamoeba invadens IP1]